MKNFLLALSIICFLFGGAQENVFIDFDGFVNCSASNWNIAILTPENETDFSVDFCTNLIIDITYMEHTQNIPEDVTIRTMKVSGKIISGNSYEVQNGRLFSQNTTQN